jgi:hypothetical protein
MSVERDFDNSIAGFLQTLLVFALVAGVVALARPDGVRYASNLNPSLERS